MSKNVDWISEPMDEVMLLEDETEDQILAKALEESLRHYREVELPRLSQQADFERPGTSRDGAHNSSYTDTALQISKEPVLYTGKDAEGFDTSAGHNWIYPTNYPVRQYQYNIVKNALFKNTLVSLPTGLGKTFIAAVVMYNFYCWFPRGKVIFMAPTKPLVHQQIDSCYKVMGIPIDDTAEMTGTMPPGERAKTWETKRVFFLTPQVLTNDLTCGTCPAASIKCVVVDEAHKAVGNHSYCQVIKALLPFNNKFRVLALSATPGSDMQAVMQVINNLLIAHVELRNEESPDIAEFTHKRNVETVVVSLGPYLSGIQERYLAIVDKYLGYLKRQKVLFGNMVTHTKFGAREAFRKSPPFHIQHSQYGNIEAGFAVCVTLLHALELLSQYGLRSFLKFLDGVLHEERGQAVVQGRLKYEVDLEQLLGDLREQLGTEKQAEPEPDVSMAVPSTTQLATPYVYSHPKLEKLQEVVVGHFRTFNEKNIVTRAMVFCQYRDTVIEVCHILQKFHPLVKPMTFVGQSSSGKSSRGFTQKQQLTVMRKFRTGGYNTLISTCVGEEGLDIGEIDLIVCFDAHKSPIRLVQRMGRTGRKREGRIVMLITEGKEHSKYKSSMYQNRTMNKKLLGGNQLAAHLYGSNPRMIPQGINPQCHQMFITVPVLPEKKTKKRKNQDIRKLLGSGELGTRNVESASPYCTDEDLAELGWDGKFVPEFNTLIDPEELHAKHKKDLQHDFSENCEKLNLGKWLEWQRDLQSTKLVKHGIDSKMLVELLDYADRKRCDVIPTQATGLLSQVNTSTLWKKKKGKRKGAVKQKTSNPISKVRKSQETATGAKRYFHFSCETDGEGNSIADYFRAPAPITSVSKTIREDTENMIIGEDESRDVEILEISDDNVSISSGKDKDTQVSASLEEIHDNCCFLCMKGLFDCQFLLPCTTSQKSVLEIERYEPFDFSCIENITREHIVAFDVKQLITPPTSPMSDHSNDLTVTGELCSKTPWKDKSPIVEKTMKPNFDLDFCALEQCFFEEEDVETPGKKISAKMNSHSESVKNNVQLEQSSKPEELKKIECFWESPKVADLKNPQNLLNKVITPISNQTNQSSTGQALDNSVESTSKPKILMSPISPILGTQKSKYPSQKCVRNLPMCSTPKVHRKNLFSKVMNKDANIKNNNLMYGLENSSEEIHINNDIPSFKQVNLPTLNFDLVSCTQLLNNLDCLDDISGKDSGVSNKNEVALNCDNTTMCTVTQLVNMVDKTSTSSEKNMENKWKSDTSLKISSQKSKVNNIKSSVMPEEVSVSRRNSNEIASRQVYFHDSDDDLFADLSLNTENAEVEQDIQETVRTVPHLTDLKIRSTHIESVASPKVEINDSIFNSQFTTLPGIEKLARNSSLDELQSNNMVSKLKLNLKLKPVTTSLAYSDQQNKNLSLIEDECFVTNISQKINFIVDKRKKSPHSEAGVIANSTKDTVETSVFNSQFSPLTTFVSKFKNLPHKSPLNKDLSRDIKKYSLSLKLKPKALFTNDLNDQNTFAKQGIPVEENLVNNIRGKISISSDIPDKFSHSGNVASSTASKKKNDLLHNSQVLSPITVVPGVETTCRTVIGSTTKSYLRLKRKHKSVSLNNSNTQQQKTEPDIDKNILSPKKQNIKLDGENMSPVADVQYQNECFKTPEKYHHLSAKNQDVSSGKVDTSISEERLVFNKSHNLNAKDENEAAECPIQTSLDKSPILRFFIRRKTATISSTLNMSSEKKLKVFNSEATNQNEVTDCKIPMTQGDSPIIRPLMKKKTANISSTSDESIELNKTSLQKNLTFSTSEENNNSRILSNTKLKDKFKNKEFKNKVKFIEEDGIINLLSSDDSDFESQVIDRQKKICQNKNIEAEIDKKKNEYQKRSKQCVFVESEAEESGLCPSSSDGEDTSALDDYDSSFVSESTSQTHAEDIQAKFLNSVIRSPGRYQGKFKIPKTKSDVPLQDVFSQMEEEFDNSYEEDSFCVDEEIFSQMLDDSVLEVAEAALEAESKWKRRKRKRNNSESGAEDIDHDMEKKEENIDDGRKKRRRILTMSSSDSEDDVLKSLPIESNSVGQTNEQIKVSSVFNSLKTRECAVLLKDIQNQCSSKAEFINNTVVDHVNPVTPCSSKDPTVSAKDTDLNFSDWEFDEFDIPADLDVGTEREKSNQITTHQNKSEIKEQLIHSSPNDRYFSDSNFCNFELADLDELMTSPILSCSGHSQQSGSKAVRSLKTEFNDAGRKERLKQSSEGNKLPENGSLIQRTVPELGRERNMQDHSSGMAATAEVQVDDTNRIVMMAVRQVAKAPEIATALRAVHKVTVLVRSFMEADYIVSWRLGVLRVALSDFMRACPKNSGLASSVRALRSHFMKHVLIIENDKLTPLATSNGIRCEIWNKSSLMHLTYLRQAGVRVLYSSDKGDTARLVAMLSQLESEEKQGIKMLPKNVPETEVCLQFYYSLPSVNIALAMRMCYKFPRIIDFMDRCNTVKKIQDMLDMGVDKAARIYLVLHQALKPKIT